MKNTAINSLGYTGTVTLSQYFGQKKIKIAEIQNEGAYSLFSFLTDCLLGDFDLARVNRPTKIKLLKYIPEKKDAAGNLVPEDYESRSPFLYIVNKPEKVDSKTSESKSTVRYSFTLPRDMLQNSFDSIGLYAHSADDSNLKNFAAVVKNIPLNMQSLSTSTALVVDWELNISNK